MQRLSHSFYGKVSLVFLVLLLILGIVQIVVSLNSSLSFVRESDQALNRNLARNLAVEFEPFLKDSLHHAGIEETIHNLMVTNPRVEIYLLDGNGKIIGFFADPNSVKRTHVGLEPITMFLSDSREMPVLGDDPRNVDRQKPFSVARVLIRPGVEGYLYVILGGEQYDSASAMVRDSYIVRTTILSLALIFVFTGVVGLLIFRQLTNRFHKMTDVVKQFKQGDFTRRIKDSSNDEIGELAIAFNQMADTIVQNMEELRHTDQLRRELIANVSHDLRSPLASIQGYLETILMKEKTLNENDRSKYLQTIFDNTVMLSTLVEELFELSKFDAKQIQPNIEAFSIAELAQDIVMKFKPEADDLNVKLTAELPTSLPMVDADIGMIDRAISNLIANALRYTPAKGEVKVGLALNKSFVRVMVSDTGYGIPDEDIPKIFERFYRVEKSRQRTTGGAGLGLAITKKIVELHEKTICVESVVGSGTTFSFELNAVSPN